MRPDDIDRYRSQFGTGGFLRLTEGGARFTEGSYDYQQTSTPGIAGHAHHGSDALDAWRDFDPLRDYIVNKTVGLIDDPTSRSRILPRQRRLLAPQPDRPDRRGGPCSGNLPTVGR